MKDDKPTEKSPFPVSAVILTVLITLMTAGGAAHFLGYLNIPKSPGEDQLLIEDTQKAQLYTCGMHPWVITEESGLCPICNMELTPKRGEDASAEDTGERKIAYWRSETDPMDIRNEPGKDADGAALIPVHEDEIIAGVEIKVDPVTQHNMGIRTAVVEKGPLLHTIRTYGHITYDETRTAQVSPKFNGWIEQLHVDFTGQRVKKGEPLFEIYSPALLAAQEEYLIAHRQGNREMLSSARRRLRYFDVAKTEIRAIESSGNVRKTVTIRSSFTGVVTNKNAVEGGFVKSGTTVYTIADLSRVWVEAHIYEYELSRVSPGLEAEMTLPYIPGKVYSGKVAYIYPYLQRKTRDVVIRLEFENPDMELKPDMYADVRINTGTLEQGLIIPSEAVIRSGERNVVFAVRENNKFTPRQVTLGISLDDGNVQVLTGLAPGEIVVTSGQFLLDSESKLKEAIQKMMEAKKVESKETDDDDFFGDMEEDDFFDDMK